MNGPDPKNRMNDLTSRQWLQFQKSWFILEKNPLAEFVAFFTKARYQDGHPGKIAFYPPQLLNNFVAENRDPREFFSVDDHPISDKVDYVYLDFQNLETGEQLQSAKPKIEAINHWIQDHLVDRGYITIAVKNFHSANGSQLIAWEIAKWFSQYFLQKDEKIGCRVNSDDSQEEKQFGWAPRNSVTYFLHFRKENKPDRKLTFELPVPDGNESSEAELKSNNFPDAWYVHRPPRREKGVLLHPAKFPEDLIERYIKNFTQPGDWVLDPMAGTGSALIAAKSCERKACGIELNPEFVNIANTRFEKPAEVRLIQGDAAKHQSYKDIPAMDYCITSPPYWDMLRMRGAETQKKRKDAGLQRWYSENPHDAGNIADYQTFVDLLKDVYRLVAQKLKPDSYMTVIVKNVKKQGVIYPLAWDIVAALKDDYIYCGEQFWCQDDQRLAPFGYRYAWVSNTFHHYCLTFRRKNK
ncbi:MAG: hypothetical protein DWQ05_17700 [Calditrichaeota bacterium]|nr:MAG: hypothetical protein DWQ05_17700 [Calditrichota bacterium]